MFLSWRALALRFNSRAREGRDEKILRCFRLSCRFNSRAREGRDSAV